MENFIIEDKFYAEISELVEELQQDYGDNLEDMEDTWTETIELATIEPMFTLDAKELFELLYNSNEERFPEDNERIDSKIMKALNESIDFEKLNSMIPKLYYQSYKRQVITKKDLIANI